MHAIRVFGISVACNIQRACMGKVSELQSKILSNEIFIVTRTGGQTQNIYSVVATMQ